MVARMMRCYKVPEVEDRMKERQYSENGLKIPKLDERCEASDLRSRMNLGSMHFLKVCADRIS